MRRVGLLLLTFLLLGAVTTVAIAWAGALSPLGPSPTSYIGVDAKGRTWGAFAEEGWGVEVMTFWGYWFAGAPSGNPAGALPAPEWIKLPDEDVWFRAMRAGWPWPTLRAQASSGDALDWAIRLPLETADGTEAEFPIIPIWRGFAASTVIWAGAWVALAMVTALGRRAIIVLRAHGARDWSARVPAGDTPRAGASLAAGAPARVVLRCPRCGYDQRGVIETWIESCPMEGTCAECGLVFDWREVFNPWHALPRWCVEHAADGASRWRFPLQCIGTLMHTLAPRHFWRRISLAHPHRWRRVAAYLCTLMLALAMMGMLSNGVAAWGAWRQSATNPGITPSTGGWPVFLQGALLPFSGKWVGTFASPGIVPAGAGAAYTPPKYFAEWVLVPFIVATIFFLMTQACTALAFAALPVSRRRAKVRRGHIARVACYGAALIVVPALLGMIAGGLNYAVGSRGLLGVLSLAALACWWLLPVMVIAWWSLATKHYLRMQHGWGVGLAVVIIGSLAPLTAAGLIYLLLPGPL